MNILNGETRKKVFDSKLDSNWLDEFNKKINVISLAYSIGISFVLPHIVCSRELSPLLGFYYFSENEKFSLLTTE